MGSLELKLNNAMAPFEQGLNIAGYIPLVSTVSGVLRHSYGKMEIIAGVAAGALFAIVALFNPNAQARQKGLQKAVEVMMTYSLHGIANICRAWIEVVPFLSLVTCLPYDLMGKRFAYPQENPGHWEYVSDAMPAPRRG